MKHILHIVDEEKDKKPPTMVRGENHIYTTVDNIKQGEFPKGMKEVEDIKLECSKISVADLTTVVKNTPKLQQNETILRQLRRSALKEEGDLGYINNLIEDLTLKQFHAENKGVDLNQQANLILSFAAFYVALSILFIWVSKEQPEPDASDELGKLMYEAGIRVGDTADKLKATAVVMTTGLLSATIVKLMKWADKLDPAEAAKIAENVEQSVERSFGVSLSSMLNIDLPRQDKERSKLRPKG